jgi:hypothetical protein
MRRQLVLMLTCLVAFLAAVALVNLIANPYGAWPVTAVDRIYVRTGPGIERCSTPYRVRHEEPELLLVGTSRILYGMAIEQGSRDGVLNAALSGASLEETAAIIDLALHNPRLRRIVWGVDFTTFGDHYRGIRDPPTGERLAGNALLRAQETLLSADALQASGDLLRRAVSGRRRLPPQDTLPVPWPPDAVSAAFAAIGAAPTDVVSAAVRDQHLRGWFDGYAAHRRSDAQWEIFARTVSRVRAAGVELTLLVPPMSGWELEAIRQAGAWPAFQTWKRELARFGPYWDFAGYNPVASHDEFYTFPFFCHFKPVVGHTVLRRVLGQPCSGCGTLADAVLDSGVWVDDASVESHLADADAARLQIVQTRPPYVEAVERVIAPPGTLVAAAAPHG